MKRVRVYTPKTRLPTLVSRGGGRTREEAVARAEVNLESLRAESQSGISAAIDELGELFALPGRSDDMLMKIFALMDRLLTLASHFGFQRLCDVCNELAALMLNVRDSNVVDGGVAKVYLQAMRLFGPGMPALPEAEASKVIGELVRVRTHLAVEPAPGPKPE